MFGNTKTNLTTVADVWNGWAGGGFDEISNCLMSSAGNTESVTTTYVDNLVGLDKDPNLGELADNGGNTLTMAIPNNSQAVNAGANPFGFLYDQRGTGYPREYGDGVDIGAFEYSPSGSVFIVK
jgi:hypothetical protein